MGSEPIKYSSKMTNFELKSQYGGMKMPRRGDFASITSNCFIGGLLLKIFCPTTDYQLLTSLFLRFSVLSDSNNWIYNIKTHGILDFDIIGVSYYPQWQFYTPYQLGVLASTVYNTYGIQLLVAETGHIWTRSWNDNCHNLMSYMAPGYPEVPCPQLQKDFLIEVKNAVRDNHGYGVLAWEPGWVSSTNVTLWGVGSNWENVAFFDFNNELLTHGGIEFLNDNNGKVTFSVDMTAAGSSARGYITGDFTDNGFGTWQIIPMNQVGTSNVYTFSTYLSHGQTVEYFYLSDSTWTARETVPDSLQVIWNDRGYTLPNGTDSVTINNIWVNP